MNKPRAEFLADAHVTELKVNGKRVRVTSAPVTRLADVLRDELGLTGTKIGCNADCVAAACRQARPPFKC